MHDRVERENIHVNIWAPPGSPYLTDELLIQADRLWQEAEAAVAEEPEILGRVRLSRMSVDYAILERALRQAQYFHHDLTLDDLLCAPSNRT